MTRYTLSPEADADLDDIWLYVARDSVKAANRVRDQILDALDRLAEYPQAGHVREDIVPTTLRVWPVHSWEIIYPRRHGPTRNRSHPERRPRPATYSVMEGATKSEDVRWYNGDTRRRNPTVEITLTPEQERIVRRGMASGRYASREELVGEALHVWSNHTRMESPSEEAIRNDVDLLLGSSGSAAPDRNGVQTLPALNEALRAAVQSLDRGEGIPGEDVYEELKRRSADRRSRA